MATSAVITSVFIILSIICGTVLCDAEDSSSVDSSRRPFLLIPSSSSPKLTAPEGLEKGAANEKTKLSSLSRDPFLLKLLSL
ncbi:hypothetical protein L6452_22295 [Arctium lappa]|uniref:Uncharacterized protein n=1 Tax=Arctium lappa TaxID=4217 RepID=A0ACB9B0N0_ARCLA|nr:hypothetical protein L6452_22295 [Arctium lappa]